MSAPDIIIPTCKTVKEISPLVEAIKATCPGARIIPTSFKQSAAANRNAGLAAAMSDTVIMVDDDITDFPFGEWHEELARPLENPAVLLVSARLMNAQGKPGTMNGSKYRLDSEFEDVAYAPSACIAFRNDGLRFCEEFRGSGFEDTWFCDCLRKAHPGGRIVIHNGVRVVHKNEMKNQLENFDWNSQLYERMARGKD